MNHRMVLGVIFSISFLMASAYAEVPPMMSYQGKLTDQNGDPVADGDYCMEFKIYDAETDGNIWWSETQDPVPVANGLFSVLLGSVNSIPDTVFEKGPDRWLGVAICGENEMTPRQRIASVGYAFTDNDWVLIGNVLYPAGDYGLSMRQSNVLYGNKDSTHVCFGVACTTGYSGQLMGYCTVSGGWHNTASWPSATVGGGRQNTASGHDATVGGGYDNIASDLYSTVSGGVHNTADGWYSTVSGGSHNSATASGATVGGGIEDSTDGSYSFIAGRQVVLTSSADYTFAFGRSFTTSTPNAVIFHNTVNPIKVGIGITAPTEELHVVGDIYCTGKLTSDGGNDPPYVLYNKETRGSIRERVAKEVPEDKLDGAVLFWNGEDLRFEVYLPTRGEFRDMQGNLLGKVSELSSREIQERKIQMKLKTGD